MDLSQGFQPNSWGLGCWLVPNVGILWKINSLHSLIFSLKWETNTQKNWAILQLQFLNDKIPFMQKKPWHFAIWQKLVFWSILSSRNWSFAKLLSFFFLSFSHERNWEKRSWAILQNFNSWMIKLTKTPIFAKLQSAKVFFA